MKLQPSSRLLVCLFWDVSWGALVVLQSPDVSVVEGEPTNITCCWTEMFYRLSVNWLKNQAVVKSEMFLQSKKCLAGSDPCNCSTLNFTRTTREHSGTYVCTVHVEIPIYAAFEGNGTTVAVSATTRDTGDGRDDENETPILVTATTETTDGTTCKITTAERKRRLIIPETVENVDESTHETTARDDQQEDFIVHIMRCLPVLALFLTFVYLYKSASNAEKHATDSCEENPSLGERTEGNQEDEGGAKSVNEKEDGTAATSTV